MAIAEESLTQAVQDLAAIRRAIEQTKAGLNTPQAERFNIILQAVLVILSLSFLIVEFWTGREFTASLYLSTNYPILRYLGVCSIGAVLAVLCIALYASLWNFSRQANESFESFVARNFKPLLRVSFLSDLFIKFAVIAGMILVQRPDTVPAFLLLFTADYLLQGRLFVLPWRVALGLGALFMGLGTWSLLIQDVYLEVPFGAFLVASVTSLSYLLWRRKVSHTGVIA